MSNPFRYFNSSPEVIRLVVMMYVRYPLSLRNVEDLLAERGIDISHETARFWWNRLGPDIRRRDPKEADRADASLSSMALAFGRGDCEGQWQALFISGAPSTMKARYWTRSSPQNATRLRRWKLLKRILKKYGRPRKIVTDGLCFALFRGDERGRRRQIGTRLVAVSTIGRRNSHQPFLDDGRAGDEAVSKLEDAAEVQLSSRPGPQPIQSGAPSRHPAD